MKFYVTNKTFPEKPFPKKYFSFSLSVIEKSSIKLFVLIKTNYKIYC